LIERYQLYKYIVAHHRVHLFDELLERCMLVLLKEGRLDPFLDALTQLLHMDISAGHSSKEEWKKQRLRRKLLHIDDSWIDVQVRDRYADFDTGDGPSAAYFEAFLESRGRLRGVFKWDQDFDKWWEGDVSGWFRSQVKAAYPRSTRDEANQLFLRFRWDLPQFLAKGRYALEKHLVKNVLGGEGALVIGITAKKVQAHIKDAEEAKFFGLRTVNEYLARLTEETAVFNLWFEPDNSHKADSKVLLAAVLDWLGTHVLPVFLKSKPLEVNSTMRYGIRKKPMKRTLSQKKLVRKKSGGK
jgi:hypothetical protein